SHRDCTRCRWCRCSWRRRDRSPRAPGSPTRAERRSGACRTVSPSPQSIIEAPPANGRPIDSSDRFVVRLSGILRRAAIGARDAVRATGGGLAHGPPRRRGAHGGRWPRPRARRAQSRIRRSRWSRSPRLGSRLRAAALRRRVVGGALALAERELRGVGLAARRHDRQRRHAHALRGELGDRQLERERRAEQIAAPRRWAHGHVGDVLEAAQIGDPARRVGGVALQRHHPLVLGDERPAGGIEHARVHLDVAVAEAVHAPADEQHEAALRRKDQIDRAARCQIGERHRRRVVARGRDADRFSRRRPGGSATEEPERQQRSPHDLVLTYTRSMKRLFACVLLVGCGSSPATNGDGGMCAPLMLRPQARQRVDGVLDAAGQKILVYGGDEAPISTALPAPRQLTDDLWSYDVACGTWTELGMQQPPGAQGEYTAVLDSKRNRLILIAGQKGTAANPPVVEELWAYDLAAMTWTQLHPATPAGSPGARVGQRAIYDAGHDQVVMFGGERTINFNAGDMFGDTWMLDFTSSADGTWSKLAGTGPAKRRDAALATDGSRVVLFGGASDFM